MESRRLTRVAADLVAFDGITSQTVHALPRGEPRRPGTAIKHRAGDLGHRGLECRSHRRTAARPDHRRHRATGEGSCSAQRRRDRALAPCRGRSRRRSRRHIAPRVTRARRPARRRDRYRARLRRRRVRRPGTVRATPRERRHFNSHARRSPAGRRQSPLLRARARIPRERHHCGRSRGRSRLGATVRSNRTCGVRDRDRFDVHGQRPAAAADAWFTRGQRRAAARVARAPSSCREPGPD